jgi:hypothetical protein
MQISIGCELTMGLLVMSTALIGATSGVAQTAVPVQNVQIADGIYQFMTAPDG